MTALTVFAQYSSLILGVPVAIVALFLYTQPLWTIFISRIFMNEKITKRNLMARFIVLLGVLILVNPLKTGEIKSWLGIFIALFGGLTLSGWISIGSFVSKKGNSLFSSKFQEIFYVCLILILVYPLVGLILKNPSFISLSLNWSLKTWFYIFLFAIFVQIINHVAYLYGVKKVSTIDAGIIMLLEPVSAAVLAMLFLYQQLTINIIIGGLLILFANYLIISKKDKN